MPKVSIIVPVYNVEKYLDRCVNSIIKQSFPDYELFLVDDGSPDNCPQMCDDWAKRDSRITVIHKANGGLSDARNVAIDIAAGEYLSFIDSDDYVAPDFLETMLSALENNNAKMAICNIESVDENNNTAPQYIPYDKEKKAIGKEIYESLYQPSACNKIYKKELFRNLRYPKGRLFEDTFVYHEILGQLDKIVYTGKTGYYYFVRSDSIMHDEYKLKNTDIIDAVYLRAKFLDEHDIHDHADEAYLAVYSRLATAYTLLDKTKADVKARLAECQSVYDSCYDRMIHDKHFSAKQKFRIWLLHTSPYLHVKLFPMNTK